MGASHDAPTPSSVPIITFIITGRSLLLRTNNSKVQEKWPRFTT